MAKQQPGKISKPQKESVKTKKAAVKRAGFFQRNSFAVFLFFATFVVFFNSIDNEYALDDEFYTAGANKLTAQGFKGIPAIFKTRAFFNNDGTGYAYRPIALTSFAIEIQFFGENPHVSHFINVLLYALTIVLLFAVLRQWLPTQGNWLPFFIALLFLVHPIHTEVVDNIKCRDELLAFLFVLLTLFFYGKYNTVQKPQFLVFAFLAFFAALLSKRTTLPFLLLIPFAMWFFTGNNWKRLAIYTGILVAGYFIFACLQFLLPVASRTFQSFENPLPHHNFFGVTATSSYVLGRYLALHIFPHPLVYYYGFKYIPLVKWNNVIAIASLLVHAGLFVFAIREIRKKTLLSFGILFYLANIVVYSNLFQPAPGLMAERFAYSSSLGFCIAAVAILFRVFKTDPKDFYWKNESVRTLRFALVAVLFLFTLRDWFRNGDWKDKPTLYTHDIEYLHESAKANMLLGSLNSSNALQDRLQAKQLMMNGDQVDARKKLMESQQLFSLAQSYFKKATEVSPDYHTAWNNLGTTYFFNGDWKGALPYFKKSVEVLPKYPEGLMDIAMAYDSLHMPDSCEYFLRKAIWADSAYPPPYERLSMILFKRDTTGKTSINLLYRAAKNNPNSESPWNVMSAIYGKLGDTATAVAAMETAAKINPSNLQRLYRLSMYYRGKGDFAKANEYQGMLEEEQAKQEKQNRRQQKQQQ